MNILVTGGAGFVGTNLIKRLLELKHNVISIDNYYTGFKSNHQVGATYITEDIRGITDYGVYGKIDFVFHLAAIARIQPSFQKPIDYFETNASATFRLALFCAENNIPIIYAGSSSHHSGKFKNPYTFSKDIGEETILLCESIYTLKANIARFYNVYGPYHLKSGEYTTLIGRWEYNIENNLPLIIYGDGSKRRDFTHVDDIIDALILMVETNTWGNIFELGRGENYSVSEIADMFNHPVKYESEKVGEADITLCDFSLANNILGWHPNRNIKDYIRNYKESLCQR
jgi:UDP-glucose 4-epimerase